jgi:hypothetical protein
MLLSPEKRRQMVEAGARLAWDRFSYQSVARQMLGLFNQVIDAQHNTGNDKKLI